MQDGVKNSAPRSSTHGVRFRTRLALFMVGILGITQAINAAAVLSTVRENIIAETREQLIRAEPILLRSIDDLTDRLTEAARLLAMDYGFRETVATGDRPTALSAISNLGRRIDARRVMLVDLDGAVTVDTRTGISDGMRFPYPELLRQAEEGGVAVSLVAEDGAIEEIAVLPILAPVPIGYVTIGLGLDRALATALSDRLAAPLDISFIAWLDSGETVVVSTLEEGDPALLAARIADGVGQDQPEIVSLAGSDYLTLSSDLTATGGGEVKAVLQYSVSKALARFQSLLWSLGGLLIAALVLALFGSVMLAGGIARPVAALTRAAARIQRGDYGNDADLEAKGEFGQLADAFRRMRSAIEEREQHILYQSQHDSLTGLPNRASFSDALDISLAAGEEQPVSVLLLGVERLPEITSTLGHRLTDRLLVILAGMLREVVPDTGRIARQGEAGFLLALPGGPSLAEATARRLIERLLEPVWVDNVTIDLRIRIGIAAAPEHGSDARILLQRAEVALFLANKSDSRVALYSEDRDPHRPEMLSLMGELRQGLGRGEFHFLYQPKVDLVEGRCIGAEALVRWQHPKHGAMRPDQFIPLAEETGDIVAMTRWAVDAACAQLADWRGAGRSLSLAVNLSARDLADSTFPTFVSDCLRQYELEPDCLSLEVTESAAMRDRERALSVLAALDRLGVPLAVDDYGIDQSSLAYLKQLPVGELKIDKAFVQDLAKDMDDAVIVRTTIDMGHNLGRKVTAEGVEDLAAYEMLRAFGCDTAQGYYIAKPLPVEEFEAFLRDSAWRLKDIGETHVEAG